MRMAIYEPKAFWNDHVSGSGDLANVGHKPLGSYNDWAYQFRLAALEAAIKGIDLSESRVFEAAYGEGFYLKYWSQCRARCVDGMDISNPACQAALAKYPEYGLRCGDLTDRESFEGLEKYDLVTAIDVLYHIVDDQLWAKALRNLLDLVDDNGVFITSDKFPLSGVDQKCPHVRRRSLAMWREHLEENGFTISRIVPVFLFMDDPITNGVRPMLGQIAMLQWRVITKSIKLLKHFPTLQSSFATTSALLQYLPEKACMSFLPRTPNLEILVCERTDMKAY